MFFKKIVKSLTTSDYSVFVNPTNAVLIKHIEFNFITNRQTPTMTDLHVISIVRLLHMNEKSVNYKKN